jgi:hypothetical protein
MVTPVPEPRVETCYLRASATFARERPHGRIGAGASSTREIRSGAHPIVRFVARQCISSAIMADPCGLMSSDTLGQNTLALTISRTPPFTSQARISPTTYAKREIRMRTAYSPWLSRVHEQRHLPTGHIDSSVRTEKSVKYCSPRSGSLNNSSDNSCCFRSLEAKYWSLKRSKQSAAVSCRPKIFRLPTYDVTADLSNERCTSQAICGCRRLPSELKAL